MNGKPGRRPTAPHVVRASNASPLTLDGTRTYRVGDRRAAVIDPGPSDPEHLDAVAAAVGGAATVAVLVTHGHPDHAEGAERLADRLDSTVRAAAAGTLREGDRIATDAGELVALETPGHSPDHIAFHWPARNAVFCGDLMLGGQETTLVASPEGDLTAYLESLERIRALSPAVIYPTHGPPFTSPAEAIAAYVHHREERQRQVLAALGDVSRSSEQLLDDVYGAGLEPRLRRAAEGALVAYLHHLARAGRVRSTSSGRWARA